MNMNFKQYKVAGKFFSKSKVMYITYFRRQFMKFKEINNKNSEEMNFFTIP